MLKTYTRSGIKCIQLRSFNETAYFKKIADLVEQSPGLTADRIAAAMKINVVVMREQILQALELGFICSDESHEGMRYHPNLIIQWKG
jgi:hypothetical protein